MPVFHLIKTQVIFVQNRTIRVIMPHLNLIISSTLDCPLNKIKRTGEGTFHPRAHKSATNYSRHRSNIHKADLPTLITLKSVMSRKGPRSDKMQAKRLCWRSVQKCSTLLDSRSHLSLQVHQARQLRHSWKHIWSEEVSDSSNKLWRERYVRDVIRP